MIGSDMDRPTPDDLAGVPLLASLSRDDLERVAAIGEVVVFEEGSQVFREGDHSHDLYVVLEGRVTLCSAIPARGETCFLTLRACEMLGFSALLARPRVATAHVVQRCRLVRLPGPDLLELCESDHDVGYAIMRRAFEEIADRLQTTRVQLLDIFGAPRR